MARQLICRGEKKSFQRRGLRRQIMNDFRIFRGSQKFIRIEEFSVLKFACDVEHGFAFANGKRALVHVAIRQRPENVFTTNRAIEMIFARLQRAPGMLARVNFEGDRSEEHTSELQSHSFISYAVFCLKKKKQQTPTRA